ncbi:MAG: AEC family transporter [Rhizobiaceae bacterium]|nr:AEC family transporter [Rhizobiaceae bacterium]
MLAIFESILPIFLLIVAGLLLRRTPLMDGAGWRGLEQLSYWVLYPILLFDTVSGADFSSLSLDAMFAALLGSVFIVAAGVLATWPIWRAAGAASRAEFSSVFQTALRWNGFVALAVAQKLYPPEGAAVVALAMAVIIIPINIMSVSVVSRFGHGGANWANVLRAMAKNPLIVAVGAGLLIRLLPGGLYEPVERGFDLLGQAAIGMGLLSIGAGLRPADMFSARPAMWFPVVVKLLVMPALMCGLGLAVGLTGPALVYVVLCGSVPTALNGYMLARQLGGDAEFYAAVTTLQTVLAVLTMPAALALAAYAASG